MARGARDTHSSGDKTPQFQIRSQALRAMAPPALPDVLPGLDPALVARDASPAGGPHKTWREADLTRAIKAAEKAGLQSYRIDAAPDGTISILVGMTPEG